MPRDVKRPSKTSVDDVGSGQPIKKNYIIAKKKAKKACKKKAKK